MTRLITYRWFFILLEVLSIAVLGCSVYFRTQRAGLPEAFLFEHPVASIISVDGTNLDGGEEIEFLLVSTRIGDTVAVSVGTPSARQTTRIALEPLNTPFHVAFYSFVGILIYFFGLAVYLLKREDVAAKLFHITATCAGVATVASREIVGLPPPVLGYLAAVFHFSAYSFLPACFLHFTSVFPRSDSGGLRRYHRLMYGVASLFVVWQAVTYFPAAAERSVEMFHAAQRVFHLFNVFLLAGFLAGFVQLGYSYRRAEGEESRKKLLWVISGFTAGTAPFILLWVLPKALFSQALVGEEFFQVFLLLVPTAFAIAIVRYHVMDIDVIVKRGSVYTIVLGLLVGGYALVVGAIALVIPTPPGVASAVAAVLMTLLFEPVRTRTQKFVDKRFFHVRYDMRETLPRIVEELKDLTSVAQLAATVVRRAEELIAPERIGFFTLQESNKRLNLVAHRNFQKLERYSIPFEIMKLRTKLQLPVGLGEYLEPGISHEPGDPGMFRRWEIAVAFPMLTEKSDIIGFLVLGEKKSGERFSSEDVNLLRVVTTQAGLALERIRLQVEILIEQEESRHLAELNEMKSYFVSSVSHDLKTPLSAIHMHAELLRLKKTRQARKSIESLEIIEGECEKLAHLIDNVLDAAQMEAGSRNYQWDTVELNSIVKNVLRLMKYELKMRGFTLRTRFSRTALKIHGDATAVERAVVNLVANAMKYSEEKKSIAVSTLKEGECACIRVEDKGIGISSDEQRNIFEKYYRSGGQHASFRPGLGLGLSIVKHVMDAHGGWVTVESAPMKGSTFTLKFPVRKKA